MDTTKLTEIATAGDQHGAWGLATTAFAVAQAASAYGMSWIFAQSHAYEPLYLIGAVAFDTMAPTPPEMPRVLPSKSSTSSKIAVQLKMR